MAQTLELDITGMTCDHCVNAVTNALKEVPGVADARVNLATKSAVVEGDNFDAKALIAAVEEEGYEASPK
jgi:copper chaperone